MPDPCYSTSILSLPHTTPCPFSKVSQTYWSGRSSTKPHLYHQPYSMAQGVSSAQGPCLSFLGASRTWHRECACDMLLLYLSSGLLPGIVSVYGEEGPTGAQGIVNAPFFCASSLDLVISHRFNPKNSPHPCRAQLTLSGPHHPHGRIA